MSNEPENRHPKTGKHQRNQRPHIHPYYSLVCDSVQTAGPGDTRSKGRRAERPTGVRTGERGPYTRRRDRVTPAEVENMQAAVRFAFSIGHPITHALTIIPNRLEKETTDSFFVTQPPEEATIAFTRKLGGILDRLGLPRVYYWWREHTELAGDHLHVALSLPERYEKRFLKSLAKVIGVPRGNDSPMEGILGGIARSKSDGWLVQRNMRGLQGALGWVRYAAKGLDGSQGATHGKRCGVANAIGQTARAKWHNQRKNGEKCPSFTNPTSPNIHSPDFGWWAKSG